MPKPLVSISCLTFNHALYLRECLDGFLMQQTNFDFEVIIHDDASTDETKGIIEEYNQNHPGVFFPMYQTENQYSKGVRGIMARFNFPRCRGKYIALCEGDDYWTDPLKLQKQVDFLEANDDYVLSFTNRDILKETGLEVSKSLSEKGSFSKAEIPYIHVPTLTVVFRNVAEKIPPKMYPTLMDASLFLFLSQFGSFFYIDKRMAVYRMHQNGMYSGGSELYKVTTSINARIAAWKHLKKIDRVALTHQLIYLFQIKIQTEMRNKKYFNALHSRLYKNFFLFYVYSNLLFQKILSKTPNKIFSYF